MARPARAIQYSKRMACPARAIQCSERMACSTRKRFASAARYRRSTNHCIANASTVNVASGNSAENIGGHAFSTPR